MRARRLGVMFVAVCAAVLSGCVHKGAIPASVALSPATYASLARYQRVYVLSPGDQLEISVDRLPELSRTVVVRPDGFVSLPRMGEIKLAGLSVPEADEMLRKLFAKRVVEPEVTVIVMNPREDVVFVAGEVGRAMPVPLRQAHTVAEALILAGGPTRAAAMAEVALIRLDDTGHLVASMIPRVSRGITGSYLNMQVVPIRSGDLIVVPESNRSQFARFIQDFIATPLNGVNQLVNPYLQYRILQRI